MLEKLTDEMRAELKPHAEKWIANGLSTKPMDDNDKSEFKSAIEQAYKLIGRKEPRVVFVKSPLVGKYAAGLASALLHKTKGKVYSAVDSAVSSEVDSEVDSAVYSAVSSEVDSEVYSAVRSEVDSEVYSAVYSAVDSAVDSAVYSAVSSAVYSAVYSAVDSAVDSAVYSAVSSAVYSAVDSAVSSAVDSAVDSAVYSAVRSAVSSEVDSEVDSEVYSAVRSAVSSAVESEVDSAVSSAVESEVRSAVSSAVESEVRSAVRSAVESEVRSAVSSAVESDKETFKFDYKSVIDLSFKLKLGSFGIECCYKTYRMVRGGNLWSAWPAYLTFFKDKASLSDDILKRLDIFEKLSTHGSYYWCHEDFVIVSDRPEFIKLDEQKRPHSLDGPFVQWRDGSGLYAINGQKVPAYICETAKDKFTKEMILSESNVDYRRFIIEKIGIEKAIDILGAKVVDIYESRVGGRYELLHIDYDGQGSSRPYLKMYNPSLSGVVHIEGVDQSCKTVKEAIMYRWGLKKFIEPEVLT